MVRISPAFRLSWPRAKACTRHSNQSQLYLGLPEGLRHPWVRLNLFQTVKTLHIAGFIQPNDHSPNRTYAASIGYETSLRRREE